MKKWKVYLGPPGTGKTTTLLGETERAIKSGLDPIKIAFVSFTRQAVWEAMGRTGKTQDELPYFRTIHSLGFRLCGLSTGAVMQREHYQELGERLGIELSGNFSRRQEADELCQGDQALAVIERARARLLPLYAAWQKFNLEVDWRLVDLLARSLEAYKKANLLVDYTGMLERYLEKGVVPPLQMAAVDEAQDLSPLQWRVLDKLTADCPLTIIAGDDDQAIYQWAGADPKALVGLALANKPVVLSQSWRLPRTIHRLAMRIISDVKERIKKDFLPRPAEGSVDFRSSLEDIDMGTGEWLVLLRNRYLANEAVAHCRREGFYYDCFMEPAKDLGAIGAAFAWERLRKGEVVSDKEANLAWSFASDRGADRIKKPWFEALDLLSADEMEYIRAMRRRGEKLAGKPRIRIDTIHGAKGGECESVVLATDMAYKTHAAMDDDEHRVFYVGVTRAKKCLYVLRPTGPCCFDLEKR